VFHKFDQYMAYTVAQKVGHFGIIIDSYGKPVL